MISNRHLGGAAELSQRSKMAESGRRVLQWISDSDFDTSVDPLAFRSETQPFGAHAEAWIAAYRMTPEGRRFVGVTKTLKRNIGLAPTGSAAA